MIGVNLGFILLLVIFLPIVQDGGNAPYVNEWQTKVFIDEGASVEDEEIAHAWNYMDPSPVEMSLSPDFIFIAPEGWAVDYFNYYLIEDHSYHWFTGLDEEESCFVDVCVAQGDNWFSVRGNLDIDVMWVKLNEE